MSEPIRVLHVLQRMEAAGVQSFLMNIYRYIDREKVQFDFLVHYTEPQIYDDEIISLGGKVYRLSFREDKNLIKYHNDLSSFFTEHDGYKIVHGHMDSLGVMYLGAAKRAVVPNRIAHAHNVLVDNSPKKKIRHILNRSFQKNATQLFACSDEAGRYMFGTSPFEVIRNPIDVDRFAFNEVAREEIRKEFGIEDRHVIGHVGRFAPQKNHKFLLGVFKKIYEVDKKAILLLVGDGEDKDDVVKLAHEMKIGDAIIFAGIRHDVEKFYQAFDVFLFPSLYEGLGIVVIEAQAAGLPVVCSDRVPKMACITERCSSIPLEYGIKVWADKALSQLQYSEERYDMSNQIKTAGYNVSTVSEELMNKYIDMMGGYFYLGFIPFLYITIRISLIMSATQRKKV